MSTGTSKAYSMWRVYYITSTRAYMHQHGCHGIPWQLTTCAKGVCVYQALFFSAFMPSSQTHSLILSAEEGEEKEQL